MHAFHDSVLSCRVHHTHTHTVSNTDTSSELFLARPDAHGAHPYHHHHHFNSMCVKNGAFFYHAAAASTCELYLCSPHLDVFLLLACRPLILPAVLFSRAGLRPLLAFRRPTPSRAFALGTSRPATFNEAEILARERAKERGKKKKDGEKSN